ncbi:MAG: aminodeoxychorismate synthase component I [Halioglobus sp.]|nr:aminodeoxychorismate synthase component I [Halioglobus sp.]
MMTITPRLDEIPYCSDSCALFERIRHLSGAILLDSSHLHGGTGRFDIMSACPENTGLPQLPQPLDEAACRAWFSHLRDFHRRRYGEGQRAMDAVPFSGGLLGYIGYDCGNGLNRVAPQGGAPERFTGDTPVQDAPCTLLQAYDWAVVQDHVQRRAVLVSQPCVLPAQRTDLLRRLRESAPVAATPRFRLNSEFRSNLTRQQYRRAFEKIRAYLLAGDCYQVNLAQRFSAAFEGDPWHAYRLLRGIAAAPFSAYLTLGQNEAVLSLSPERFIALQGRRVETAPVKGTRPRYSDPLADTRAAAALRISAKDRAENLMIVDLLRNDLGRSCEPGSIRVDRLFDVHSYATVHHLVSTISGTLRDDRGAFELLRDSFPGGSITGAPKRRAMEIIAELEPHPRQVYCGSVLYVSADGRMDSNIAIRTLLCRGGNIHCWSGGGIVADSRWQDELQETYDKVGRFLEAL